MKLALLQYKTRGLLKSNPSLRTTLPYKQSHSIGILFTAENKQKHEEIKELIKKLELDGKKVTVISFLPKNTENFDFLFDFFSEKDVNFWGTVTSENAIRFTEMPFDFLLYLDTTPNPMLMHLIARSKAHCRAGRFWSGFEKYFELMIESKETTRSLIEGIYKYTSVLH